MSTPLEIESGQALKILVPLDGSAVAEAALDHALALSKAFASQIWLFRVVDPEAQAWPSMECVDWQLERRQSEAYLRRLAEQLQVTGVAVRWFLQEGRVAEAVTDFCRSAPIDLVVMTRHGRGDASAFSFGGTAQKIVSSAPASVMLVDSRSAAPVTDRFRYAHILVPVDGSRESEWALGIAVNLARPHGARLTVLQVVERPRPPGPAPAASELRELGDRMTQMRKLLAERRVRELVAQLPHDGLNAAGEVLVADDASLAIQQYADRAGVQLIVLSAHGSARSRDWAYGRVPQAMLEHSTHPVLVCRPPEHAIIGNRFRSVFLSEPQADAV